MGNLRMRSTKAATTYDYIVKGFEELSRRKSQSVVQYNLPFAQEDSAVVAGFFGQKARFEGSFIIQPRSDDYTGGTGSPSTYSTSEQRDWIWDTVLDADASHFLLDQDSNIYEGKFSDVNIIEQGDDPSKVTVRFTFIVGQ